MIRLRGIEFCPVACASGARNFFGDGYPFHRYWKHAGLTFEGSTLKTKTATIERRMDPSRQLGNMWMREDGITPVAFRPDCIVARARHGVVLNAVGLSGPGLNKLLETQRWQRMQSAPWFLSFMPTLAGENGYLGQVTDFVSQIIRARHTDWNSPFGVELNISCPNTAHDTTLFLPLVEQALDILEELRVPLQLKFNVLASPELATNIASHPSCDAIVMGNTIPWGKLPDRIDYKRLFGSDVSPLAHYGGGGLSGPPLREIHCEWIRNARDCGLSKPIWGCGGVDSPAAAREYLEAGADGIDFGTAAIVRPWRTRSIIRSGHELFGS